MLTENVYDSNGMPHSESLGVYSYLRDLPIVQEIKQDISKDRGEIAAVLLDQRFELEPTANLGPIYGHHYIAVVLIKTECRVVDYGNRCDCAWRITKNLLAGGVLA